MFLYLQVIIDRCNFDISQRATWLDMAAEHTMNNNVSQQRVNHSLVTTVEVTTTAAAKTVLKQGVSFQDEVAMLCGMGFDPVQAMLAIQSSHGDIETAAAMLLSSSSFPPSSSELPFELPSPPPSTSTPLASSSSDSMHLKSLLKIDTTCTATNAHIVGINSNRQEVHEPLVLEYSEKRGLHRLFTIGIATPS